MAEQPSAFDLTAVAMSLVLIVVMLFIAVQLLPLIVQVLFQLLPGILILWFIVTVLRGIVKRLLP